MMRNNKELLKLILEGLQDKSISIGIKPSICIFIANIATKNIGCGKYKNMMSSNEANKVIRYMYRNKPIKTYYYNCDGKRVKYNGMLAYWYPLYSLKPRIKWLKKHIKILENESNKSN